MPQPANPEVSPSPSTTLEHHTKRTPHVIGRQEELQRIIKYLQARGESNFLYYYGSGGLGKTRLLEEVQRMVGALAERDGGYHCSGIIDLYHTDTHATSDLERLIVEGLDPEESIFSAYHTERAKYELLRERGADPSQLEELRGQLSTFFIQGADRMALDARKLVILFDTVELLQYESSIVEKAARPG